MWLFDTKTSIWQQLLPHNSAIFTRRNNFTSVLYGESIVVFGGLQSPNGDLMSDELLVLNLKPNESKQHSRATSDKICGICRVADFCDSKASSE